VSSKNDTRPHFCDNPAAIMEHNPYAAPRTEVQDVETPSNQQLATKGQRFANLLVDSFAYYLLLLIVAVIATLADPEIGETLADYSFLFSMASMLTYYVFFEALFGCTPAKLLTGTRVVTETGARPSVLQILGRSFARMVPFEPFSCLGNPPIGWHDQWSRTRVIRTVHNPSLGSGFGLQDSQDNASGPLKLGL